MLPNLVWNFTFKLLGSVNNTISEELGRAWKTREKDSRAIKKNIHLTATIYACKKIRKNFTQTHIHMNACIRDVFTKHNLRFFTLDISASQILHINIGKFMSP